VKGRLDSWKEIARYLQRDVTTVRRWEKREGLPVHRHFHDKLGTVYAYESEIDAWWAGRRSGLAEPEAAPSAGRERLAWSAAAALLVVSVIALVALLAGWRTTRQPGEHRFEIPPPAGRVLGTAAVSPDGRVIAFTAADTEGRSRLWVRHLDAVALHALPETEGAAFPFWSPDSRFIGFFADGRLKRLALSGGSPRILCDAPQGRGGTWNLDDVIVFAPGREHALHRVAASGGIAVPITTVDRPRQRGHLWPDFLPDGRHVVYSADSVDAEHHAVYVAALDGGDSRLLLRARSNAVVTADGRLLFVRSGRLVAQPFDARALAIAGEPTTIADRVLQPYGYDHKGDFSISRNGVLAFRSGASPLKQLEWIDRRGKALGILAGPAVYAEPVLSPDETRVAVSVFDPLSDTWASDIWLIDAATGARSRFTFDTAADFEPVWSPDGTHVVFASNRGGTLDLYRKRTTGSEEEHLLLNSATPKHPEAWSPDGRFLTYASLEAGTKYDISVLPVVGDRTPMPLLREEFSEGQSQISPDGRWMAYTSYETGMMEVYVRPFPRGEGKWQISTAGGADPRWRRDGKELFFISARGMLTAVSVVTDGAFTPGISTPLFDTRVDHLWDDARNHYDVARDGQRFLVTTPIEDYRDVPLTVVVNVK
jgi:Tol biopolymer transport system component